MKTIVVIKRDRMNKLFASDVITGKKVTVPKGALRRGHNGTGYLESTPKGWKQVEYEQPALEAAPDKPAPGSPAAKHAEELEMIHSSYSIKPKSLMMSEIKWKYLIRSAVRGKNIMMTGPAGCGKTMAAKSLVNSLDRPDFYFNLGATQDPRASLIGNTHYNKEKGTYFSESLFVKAIKTENAVILLDELSRAHPEAWNILMTVLDEGQRYLRLDEASGQTTVKVAPGVTFVATANIGNEYTATRVMDRALIDRFTQIEMDVLNKDEEGTLLSSLYPHVDNATRENIAELAWITRQESSQEEGKLSTHISTRTSVELTGLVYDGFTLDEAAQVSVLPKFDSAGGLESERTFVKQLLQKYTSDGSSDELFTDVEDEDNN